MEICQSKTDVAAEVKPNTHVKGDSIYVDGGYAGETTKLKNDLRPGNHDIEVRDPLEMRSTESGFKCSSGRRQKSSWKLD